MAASSLSNELNYLKSPALSQGSNPSVTKALNKFKKLKHSVCHSAPCLNPVVLPFYSMISFKISKILSRFVFIVSFRPINKIKFSSPKNLILIDICSGIYFIPCCPCNLGYIGQTRRQLNAGHEQNFIYLFIYLF